MEGTPPAREVVHQRVVRISEWATDTGQLEGRHFQDCFIMGPAIIVARETVMNNCTFMAPNPDAIFWTIEDGREWIAGAFLVVDCVFEGCRFVNVGIAGSRDDLVAIRRAIVGD
jgi:hypothetical protein